MFLSIAAWVVLVVTFLVVVVLNHGCASAPRVTAPKVAAGSGSGEEPQPATWELHCWIPEVPEAPPPAPSQTPDEQPDVMRRTMVHRLTYDRMVEYQRDLQAWLHTLATCVANLREVAHLPQEGTR